MEDPRELVIVRLGGCRYALPLAGVAEVGRPLVLTRVPGMPGWIAGVANWRGRVLAVLDLRPLLGAPAPELDRRGRVVVLTHEGTSVGLIVESVVGTTEVDPAQVEPPLASLPGAPAALLGGQVTDGEGPFGLVDLAALFGLADSVPRARRAG